MAMRATIRRLGRGLLLLLVALGGMERPAALEADEPGEPFHWRILPGESELRVLVFRSGPLARLGHNHVVATTEIDGTARARGTFADAVIDLSIPVGSFVVDDPVIRNAEGGAFSEGVSARDAERTRERMLGPELLDAARYDTIRVVSDRVSGTWPELTIHASVLLRGGEHALDLPVIVEDRDERIVATGTADVSHGQLGLSPVSTAFGAVRVAEVMILKYQIVAEKSDKTDAAAEVVAAPPSSRP